MASFVPLLRDARQGDALRRHRTTPAAPANALPPADGVVRAAAAASSARAARRPTPQRHGASIESLAEDCIECLTDGLWLRSAGGVSASPPTSSLRLVDLFCGCGGLSLGVREAARRIGLNLDVRLAVDLDPDAMTVYQTNFPHAATEACDVRDLFDGSVGSRVTTREKRVQARVGRLHLLAAGPPCQGHSDLNNHTRRDDPRNGLYVVLARATEVLQPDAVLIENVPAVRHDKGRSLDKTKARLAALGYSVKDDVVPLWRLGTPQLRRRHLLVAAKPSSQPLESILDTVTAACAHASPRSVRWAIDDLRSKERRTSAIFDSASTPSTSNQRRIAWLFDNKQSNLPNSLRPVCHQSDHSYHSMYGRLRWGEPAQTITTGFGSMGQGRYVHPSQRRTLTPHEAARLQTFPDFFDFSRVKHRSALARMIGNAVPPLMARELVSRMFAVGAIAAKGD